ncbi:hypothetical protein LP417_33225 (plasmid) [Polaromonas sp. P1-6]|nr:hypothetical protein LP417_33225 [Polaromonas sp. P1-6]
MARIVGYPYRDRTLTGQAEDELATSFANSLAKAGHQAGINGEVVAKGCVAIAMSDNLSHA